MKCPVCGHKVRPSKKVPGKYLCDTCRKRFPASAVIPDDADSKSAAPVKRKTVVKHRSVSVSSPELDFFDDPLNEPETYHSTAAALRSVRKKTPENSSDSLQPSDGCTVQSSDTVQPSDAESISDPVPPTSSETNPEDIPSHHETDSDSVQSDSQTGLNTDSPASETDSDNTSEHNLSDQVSEDTKSDKPHSTKNRYLPVAILAIVVIIAFAGFTFSRLHSSNGSSGSASSKKSENVTKEIYTQGETASYNGIEITLDSFVESEGDDWSVPAEGNEFMFVHMTITNQSSTGNDLVISSMASFENYCDDNKLDYSAAAFTALATTSDQPKLDGTLAPGETLEGYLSLEVPLNWSTVEIRYTDKIWSDNAVHFQISHQQ